MAYLPPENAEKSPVEKPKGEAIDTRLVRRLADILKDTDLTEIEVERGDLKIRVARAAATLAIAPQMITAPQLVAAPTLQPAATPNAAVEPPNQVVEGETMRGEQVKSPMVGTVYLQAQPGSKPFVRPGETVNAGQTLLIVEAMKTMNPIPAPRAGTVLRVLVEDGQPIEFGEPLVVLE